MYVLWLSQRHTQYMYTRHSKSFQLLLPSTTTTPTRALLLLLLSAVRAAAITAAQLKAASVASSRASAGCTDTRVQNQQVGCELR